MVSLKQLSKEVGPQRGLSFVEKSNRIFSAPEVRPIMERTSGTPNYYLCFSTKLCSSWAGKKTLT